MYYTSELMLYNWKFTDRTCVGITTPRFSLANLIGKWCFVEPLNYGEARIPNAQRDLLPDMPSFIS
jgi:hypothetical protein